MDIKVVHYLNTQQLADLIYEKLVGQLLSLNSILDEIKKKVELIPPHGYDQDYLKDAVALALNHLLKTGRASISINKDCATATLYLSRN